MQMSVRTTDVKANNIDIVVIMLCLKMAFLATVF